jgi:3-methylfumaryl-CoA hydratase
VARAGDPLPPLWHWLYFLDWPAQHELGEDGHPRHGRFLPPIPDRRRMVAGGRLQMHAPLEIGEAAERTSGVADVVVKHGRTGEMVFVTVRHEVSQRSRVCLVEECDVVYRSGGNERRRSILTLDNGDAAESDAAWQLSVRPDPPLLFRFSALTANAHRIHYDAPYCERAEGYPGLVVHGPALVLFMLELARRRAPDLRVRSLSYRLRKPVFAGEHVLALGDPDTNGGAGLRIATARDQRHATAEVTFA